MLVQIDPRRDNFGCGVGSHRKRASVPYLLQPRKLAHDDDHDDPARVSKLKLPPALELMLPKPEREKDDVDLAARQYDCPACGARLDCVCWWATARAERSWLAHPSRRALVKRTDARYRVLAGVASVDEVRAFLEQTARLRIPWIL